MSTILSTKRSASVVPLEYEIHPEQSVMLIDFEWDNFVSFLEDPVSYLSSAQGNWRQDARNDVPWTLATPCLARIEPITASPLPIDFLLAAAGVTDLRIDFSSGSEANFVEEVHRHWSDPTSPLSTGFFAVTYAPGTSMLSVMYLPPFKCQATPRYSKGYTTPTLIRFGNSNRGSLHVDLASYAGQSSYTRRDRAEHLVDLLENMDWLAEALNEHIRSRCHGGFMLNFHPQPEGDALTTPEPTPRRPIRFFGSPAPRSNPAFLKHLPRLTVEDPGRDLSKANMVIDEFPEATEAATAPPIDVWLLPNVINKLYFAPVCADYSISFEQPAI